MLNQKNQSMIGAASFSETGRMPRPFGRYRPSRGALFTAALLAALSAASPSTADTGSSTLLSYSPTEIAKIGVNSDGTAYEATGLIQLSAQVQVVVDAGVSGKVKSWKTWLKLKWENGLWMHFSDDAVSKSYSTPKPDAVDTEVWAGIPHLSFAPFLVGACNGIATGLRAAGLSDAEIFSQDRSILFAVDTAMTYETTGIDDGFNQAEIDEFSNYQKILLICKAREETPPQTGPGNIKVDPVDFKVTDIKLFLSTYSNAFTKPNSYTVCKKVKLSVKVQASKAGPVQFRLWKQLGNAAMEDKVVDAWASFDGNGFFFATYSEWITASQTTDLLAKAEDLINAIGLTTPWEEITLICDSGSLAPNTVPGSPSSSLPSLAPNTGSGDDVGTIALGDAPGKQKQPGSAVIALGQPDLMATTLGMSLAGGVKPWGTTLVISNPALAAAKGVGRNRNLCRFSPAAFRPFNKGTVASGPFKTTVKRNNKQVRSTTFNLPAQSGLPGNGWYKFDLDLAQGMNVIKVELDSSETVGESDEGNNDYTLRVRVNFPCGKAGDTIKTPGEPTPPTRKPRKERTPRTTTTPSQ